MSNEIYERLMSDLAKRKQNMISSVVARAKDLQADGNELEQIYELLSAQGVNHDIIVAALRVISDDHLSDLKPPDKFEDVRHILESTLYTQRVKDIISTLTAKTSFGQIMPLAHAQDLDLENNIEYARLTDSKAVMDEIIMALKPYIQNMIVHMNMLSQNKKTVEASTDLEQKIADRYMEWFGLWLPETQKAYRKKVTASYDDDESGSELDVICDESGREQTFCPMYKTEININNVCGACPFYYEIKIASTGNVSKRCKFRK